MSETTMTFGELIKSGVISITDGYRAKNSELGGDGLIFLRAGHVTDERIDFAGVERFHEKLTPMLREKTARAGDVVVTTKGNSTGRTSFVDATMPTFVYSPHLSRWRVEDMNTVDPGFLRYWSRSPQFVDQMRGLAASTDMAPYLSLRDQQRLEITLPLIGTQRAIGTILGALDDKIEQNWRTGRALEGLARATFKAWFVDFEPVRAKAAGAKSFPGMPPAAFATLPDSLTDSPIGPVPQGWEVGAFGSVMSECNSRNRGEEINLVLSAVSSGHLALSDEHFNKRVYSKSLAGYKVVETGAVAFNPSRVNIGSIGINHRLEAGVVSPVYVVCSMPREFEWFFELYLRLPASRERFVTLSSGSVRQSLRAVDFLSIELVLPDHILLRTFNSWYESIRALNDALAVESSKLAALRDYLLPRLLSGRVRVRPSQAEVKA